MAMPSMPPPADQPGPAAEPAPADDSGAGSASQVVVEVQQGLSQLMDLMDKSQIVSPEEKAQFGQIMGAYQDFVHNVLGAAPGGKPQAAPAPKGQVPMEAGGKEVTPAM
jgi:hypothetical protein